MTPIRVLALAALSLTACLTPVTESQCSTDADCTNGATCVDFKCKAPGTTGGGASGTGGGDAAGGTAATGGGDTAGGDATGGGAVVGGGSAVGGGAGAGGPGGGATGGGQACGCRSASGQCQVGDSTLACGAGGSTCRRCGGGEQCVNGACVMAACGPGTCSGCCGRGFCVTPSMQSTVACGVSGGMCSACARGQDCVNGACVTPPPCGPMTCAGCCQQTGGAPRCSPLGQQSDLACGSGGLTCGACQRGTTCTNGTCAPVGTTDGGSTGSCNPSTCGSGCCQATPAGTFCVDANRQSNLACGTGAMTCVQCQRGTTCTAGACVPTTGSDAGSTTLPNGSACMQGSPCEGQCVAAQAGYPGGYCTAQCGPGGTCNTGICVTDSVFGQMVSTCRGTCTGAGTGQGSCRQGYVCTLAPTPGALVGYCRPDCNNGNLAMCPSGACLPSGYCQ